jgi:hypothetical protein
MLSVVACKAVRPFLQASLNNFIHVHWCPAHVGVPQNELVDRLAKEGLDTLQPEFTSQAAALQQATACMYTTWEAYMRDIRYRGAQSLITPAEFRLCKHTSAGNVFLKLLGMDTQLFARVARFVTGHMPCGAFRERFHLEGHHECWCGKALETCYHILYECPLWIRKHPPPGPDGAQRVGIWGIIDFLKLNPSVGTFEWLDIVRDALVCVAGGRPRDLAYHRAEAHSRWRKAVFEEWEPHAREGDRFDKVYDPERVAAQALLHFAASAGVG